MQKIIPMASIAGIVALMAIPVGSAFAATPGFGMLYYEGEIVRTVVPPSEIKKGLDDFYLVTNPVEDQLGIAAVAPGDRNYHGGHWIVNEVTFNVAPYLLDSEQAVLDAENAGDVSIERNVSAFLCPIQPTRGN